MDAGQRVAKGQPLLALQANDSVYDLGCLRTVRAAQKNARRNWRLQRATTKDSGKSFTAR